MDDQHEREIWCKAWRLLRQHGNATESMVRAEIERALREKNQDDARYWREISAAVASLAR